MPKRDYKQVQLSKEISHSLRLPQESGYTWLPDRFGPPPGILRKEKERLDKLSDKDYLDAVLEKEEDEIEALMISEAERRRSFQPTWTFDSTVTGEDLAKAGFYCLSDGDRVKCAFCDLIMAQWRRGQTAMERHKREASFCTFVKGKAVNNIPFDKIGISAIPKLLKKKDPLDDAKAVGYMDSYHEKPIEDKPDRPDLKSRERREATFKEHWPAGLENKIPILLDAGFYMVDSEKVSCFYCGGTVEEWVAEDDPWEQHAKWYYKCLYLLDRKGGDYIRQIRTEMSEQERHESENLKYTTNNGKPTKLATAGQLAMYEKVEESSCDVKCLDETFDSTTVFLRLDSVVKILHKKELNNGGEVEAEGCIYYEVETLLTEMKDRDQLHAIEDYDFFKELVIHMGYEEVIVKEAYRRMGGGESDLYKVMKMIFRITDEQKENVEQMKERFQTRFDAEEVKRLSQANKLHTAMKKGNLTEEQKAKLFSLQTCFNCEQHLVNPVVGKPCFCYAVCPECFVERGPLRVELPEHCPSCNAQIDWVTKSSLVDD